MLSLLIVAPFVLALSPEEADLHAHRLGRPLPAVVRVDNPGGKKFNALAAGAAPFTIFMNRDGGVYRCGDEDSSSNSSGIACGASPANVGAWPGNDAEWASFMSCSLDLFARFNLLITDVEPQSGDYVEAVVGGNPGQVGMGSGIGGVAPYMCDVQPRAIVYAFADVYYGGGNWWRDVCETAAQEVVHAFGLDHEFLCEDPMTYLSGCGEKTFQDTNAQCGEFSPRSCDCTGATQNSVQEMLDMFGPSGPPIDDPVPPTVSLVSPSAGATLEANSTIQVVATASDDLGLRSVELEWDFSDSRMRCPGSGDNYECVQSGTSYTWSIRVGEGARTYRVAVTDVGQNAVVSSARTITLTVGGGGDDPADPNAPDVDEEAPTIFIASPTHGAALPANQSIQVIASISDNTSVASPELVWAFSNASYPCPHTSEYVQCAKSGALYTWTLTVGEGARSFFVRAQDPAGNTAQTPSRTIDLVEGATALPDDTREDDDTIDRSGSVRCGDSLSLEATDADWFVLEATAGTQVSASAGANELLAASGPLSSDELARGTGTVTFLAPGRVFLAVLPARADAGAYQLTIACTDPPHEPADPSDPSDPSDPGDPGEGEPEGELAGTPHLLAREGCSAGGGLAPGALVAALALLVRPARRRARSTG